MRKVLWAISLNTFRETIRDKFLYSLIGFAVLVISASLLAGSVSLGQDARVIQNFSLTAMLVFLLIITYFIGTQLVWREIERKTIYLVLTKPVTRETFYLGKFFGLCLTILVAGIIMSVMFISVLAIKTGSVPVAAYFAIGAIILEAWLLTAVSLLFSSFTSPLASSIYTFGITLIGHGSTTIWILSQKANPFLKGVLETVYYLFPNLEKFNLRNDVVFNLSPDATQVGMIVLYFAGYTFFLLLLGLTAFRKNEF